MFKEQEMRKRNYHLFMWFSISPLALTSFLDVFGRQSPHRGWVLMVAPELTDRMLKVKLPPHMFVHSVVVELTSTKMSATEKAKRITLIPHNRQQWFVYGTTILTSHLGGRIWCSHWTVCWGLCILQILSVSHWHASPLLLRHRCFLSDPLWSLHLHPWTLKCWMCCHLEESRSRTLRNSFAAGRTFPLETNAYI